MTEMVRGNPGTLLETNGFISPNFTQIVSKVNDSCCYDLLQMYEIYSETYLSAFCIKPRVCCLVVYSRLVYEQKVFRPQRHPEKPK